MQLFEFLFLLALAAGIARLVLGSGRTRLWYSAILAAGLSIIILGGQFEGWRWQMLPAYLGFAALMLTAATSWSCKRPWRIVAALPLALLLFGSAFLAHQMPVVTLPEPTGPYAVGTFDDSITDHSRGERYSPGRNRELYVELWYPADKSSVDGHAVRTLYQELNEGHANFLTYLESYLRHIPTHSHIDAPLAAPPEEGFPVLLFSHAAMGFTSQNQQLMEHLASNGYVIISIGHTYDSAKVNLDNAGTIRRSESPPPDVHLNLGAMETGLMSKIRDLGGLNDAELSTYRGYLFDLAEQLANTIGDAERDRLLRLALARELKPYASAISMKALGEYLSYIYFYQHSMVDYRVEDMQFVAGNIANIDSPVAGFGESMNTAGFGAFGMSFGGAAAGEFCKIDMRCIAGSNLDGTQFGRHWNKKVNAPFLMWYHEAHQGGNDFAYLPPTNKFWDLTVKDTMHFDFAEIPYLLPIMKIFGMSGTIDNARLVTIINDVQLGFFDHYLKGKPLPADLTSKHPEIVVRTDRSGIPAL